MMTNPMRYLLLCLCVLGLAAITTAQEGPVPTEPLTNEEGLQALDEETRLRLMAQIAQLQGRSIHELRVAYLYGDEAEFSSDLIQPDAFAEKTGAVLIADEGALLAEWEAETFDGMFIHESALSWLDADWVQARYREHVIVYGFNLQHDAMLALTGDACAYEENAGYVFTDALFAVSYGYFFTITPESQDTEALREDIHEALLETCGGVETTATIHLQQGVFQYAFSAEEELDWVIGMMVGDSVTYGKPVRTETTESTE